MAGNIKIKERSDRGQNKETQKQKNNGRGNKRNGADYFCHNEKTKNKNTMAKIIISGAVYFIFLCR